MKKPTFLFLLVSLGLLLFGSALGLLVLGVRYLLHPARQGAVVWVLESAAEEAVRSEASVLSQDLRAWLLARDLSFQGIGVRADGSIAISAIDPEERPVVEEGLRELGHPLTSRVSEGGEVLLSFGEEQRREIMDSAVRRCAHAVSSRLKYFGVTEPRVNVDPEDPHRLRLEMPVSASYDLDAVRDLILKSAVLQLKLVEGEAETRQGLLAELGGQAPDGMEIVCEPTAPPAPCYLLSFEAVVTNRDVYDARTITDPSGEPAVNFRLTEMGGERFGRITAANVGRKLAILLDGELVSAPMIQNRIEREAMIQGAFSFQEATNLALSLQSGALAAPLQVVGTEDLSGESWLRPLRFAMGVCAALVALTLVALVVVFLTRPSRT